ncbi:MAG: hypothetical protein HY000_25740 [Planctomycetes bacterium]|nr:hypothetical protein [Planctomycetota bacterium]
MEILQSSNRLRVWADKALAHWLQEVIELPEAVQRIPPRAKRAHAEPQFRVLTPELQRRIDESA